MQLSAGIPADLLTHADELSGSMRIPIDLLTHAVCQVAGKEWSGYLRNKEAQDFLDELARSLGIPRDL